MTVTASSAATESTFAGANGIEIFWRESLPEGTTRGVVVIAHGVSEHSGRYRHVAADLNEHGYAVYALDHRGHGRSAGPRCVIDRLEFAVADIDTLISIARERNPGKPLVLLGHSMGGALALAYAVRHQDRLDGLALSAPVAVLEAASPTQLAVARVLSRIVPRLGVYDVDDDAISTDPAVVRDYEQDPLVHHGKVPVRTLAELAGAVGTFPDRVPSLHLPLLLMHGSEDTLVPLEGSRMVDERAGSTSKRLVVYPGLRHEILNEPERDRVMADLRGWLAQVG